MKQDPARSKRKFSSFFKSLVIELDKDLYGPDNHLVEVNVMHPHPHRHAQTHTLKCIHINTNATKDVHTQIHP